MHWFSKFTLSEAIPRDRLANAPPPRTLRVPIAEWLLPEQLPETAQLGSPINETARHAGHADAEPKGCGIPRHPAVG
jgi:hypothetical protein